MKRFHVHVSVDNLDESIRFYSSIFGTAPSVVKPDYAKWMLEDPRVNFAISNRGHAIGINHLGIQVESSEELGRVRDQLTSADSTVVEQTGTSCCYSRSDKYWITDPAGIAWEAFHSLGNAPTYGDGAREDSSNSGCSTESECCIPLATPKAARSVSAEIQQTKTGPCCV